ncbi:MAG: hypothetical protein JXR37_23260 [Kiritimatiellae bacterium]|nr:hypothetical protein [Kiritimatiellia bacterium]
MNARACWFVAVAAVAGLAGTRVAAGPESALKKKMERIIVPTVEFRQANVVDVVKFMAEMSVQLDPEPDPARKGVNFILNLGSGGKDGAQVDVPQVTLRLRRISLLKLLDYITRVANLKYRIDKHVVMIVPADAPDGPLVTRIYPVPPTFGDWLRRAGEQEDQTADPFAEAGLHPRRLGAEAHKIRHVQAGAGNATALLAQMGVPFPDGASATYSPAISKLIVRNTGENQAILAEILAHLGAGL